MTKSIDPSYINIIKGNKNYSLIGTQFEVYSDAACTSRIQDFDGNNATLTVSSENSDGTARTNTIDLSGSYANTTVYIKETVNGKGYDVHKPTINWSNKESKGVLLGSIGETKFTSFTNIPAVDPLEIQLTKKSDVTNTTIFNASELSGNAEYTMLYYESLSDARSDTSNAKALYKMYFRTNATGHIEFTNVHFMDQLKSDLDLVIGGKIQTIDGTYKVFESQVPTDSNGVETGLLLSSDIFYFVENSDNKSENETTTTVYRNDTLIDSKKTAIDAVDPSYDLASKEPETWLPIGVQKVDSNRLKLNQNSILPQGNAKLSGAVYTVLTTDKDKLFKGLNAARSNYKGKEYSVSNDNVSYNGTNYYYVLVDGRKLTMTTDTYGYAITDSPVPYSDKLYVQEITAPLGYKLNSSIYHIDKKWTTDNGKATLKDIPNIQEIISER